MNLQQICGWFKSILFTTAIVVATVVHAGCQSTIGGSNGPGTYYTGDDVQYFPPGSEFKLQREAAVMKEFKPQQQLTP